MASKPLMYSHFKMGNGDDAFSFLPNNKTLPDFIRHWRDTKPDEEAFVFVSTGDTNKRTAVTWRQLYENSVEHGKAFISLGVKKQDVVAMNLHGCPESLYMLFGVMFAGAIPFNTVFSYKDGIDMINILNTVKSSTFILDPTYEDQAWPTFKTFLKSMGNNGSITSETIPSLRLFICTSRPDPDSSVLTIEEALQISSENLPLPSIDKNSIAILWPTSGSTGSPKVVAHTHASLLGNNVGNLNLTRRVYCELNFNWSGHWPRNVIRGDTWICEDASVAVSEDPISFMINTIQREKCTDLGRHPHKLMEITDRIENGKELFTVTRVTTSGQPLGQNIVRCLGLFCSSLTIIYGATECLIASLTLKEGDQFEEHCCGTPTDGVEVKIVDDSGEILPVNTRGELLVKGPYMFAGYYNDLEGTRAAFTEDGWFKTDDIAKMTENGTLFVEGRKSEMIISGSHNVLPRELESILSLCSGVQEVAIVPIKDETFYQKICACIVIKEDSCLSEDDVKTFCEDFHIDKRGTLTCLPDFYLFFDSFPKTHSGKVNKLVLAENAKQRLRKGDPGNK